MELLNRGPGIALTVNLVADYGQCFFQTPAFTTQEARRVPDMTIRCAKYLLTLLAILGTSMGMAATVNITASTLTPTVGDTFTLTITGDSPNTFAATMGLSFDASKVEYVSGIALAPWNVFVKNSLESANPTVFDVESPSAMAANPGVYNVAELTFLAIASGAANIVIDDDGGNVTGWFDADTADYIPNTYTQPNVVISANGPVITVTDSIWVNLRSAYNTNVQH